jgi:5,10-methylenetetrahydrofolate reductase
MKTRELGLCGKPVGRQSPDNKKAAQKAARKSIGGADYFIVIIFRARLTAFEI